MHVLCLLNKATPILGIWPLLQQGGVRKRSRAQRQTDTHVSSSAGVPELPSTEPPVVWGLGDSGGRNPVCTLLRKGASARAGETCFLSQGREIRPRVEGPGGRWGVGGCSADALSLRAMPLPLPKSAPPHKPRAVAGRAAFPGEGSGTSTLPAVSSPSKSCLLRDPGCAPRTGLGAAQLAQGGTPLTACACRGAPPPRPILHLPSSSVPTRSEISTPESQHVNWRTLSSPVKTAHGFPLPPMGTGAQRGEATAQVY